MLEERVAQLEEQLLGGEGDGQQQHQLRLQAEDHLLERSKLRSTTESILSVCVHRSLSSGYSLVFSQSAQTKCCLAYSLFTCTR